MSEEWGRLINLFQREQGVFNRWFYFLILLGIFFFFIFIPFLQTQQYLEVMQELIDQNDKELAENNKELNAVTASLELVTQLLGGSNELKELHSEVDSWVESIDGLEQKFDLRERRINALRDTLSAGESNRWQRGKEPPPSIITFLEVNSQALMRGFAEKPDCFWQLEVSWIICEMRLARSGLDKSIKSLLYKSELPSDYKDGLEDLIIKNRTRYYEGVDAAFSEGRIKAWTKDYLDGEVGAINSWVGNLNNEKVRLELEKESIEVFQEPFRQETERLKKRQDNLKSVYAPNTPIGRLPISFNDLLLVLPVLLLFSGIGLMRSNSKLMAIRMRSLSFVPDDIKPLELDSYLDLLLPVWNPSIKYVAAKQSIFLVYLLPMVVAIAALILLNQAPIKENPTIDYGGVFNIALLAIIFAAYIFVLAHSTKKVLTYFKS